MCLLPDTTPDQCPVHTGVFAMQSTIGSFSPNGPLLLFRSQEFSGPLALWVVLQEEVADEAADCGEDAFENELRQFLGMSQDENGTERGQTNDPVPAVVARGSAHKLNSICKQSREGSCNCSC